MATEAKTYKQLSKPEKEKALKLAMRNVVGDIIQTNGESICEQGSPLQKDLAKIVEDRTQEPWAVGMNVMAHTYEEDGVRHKMADVVKEAALAILEETIFVSGYTESLDAVR